MNWKLIFLLSGFGILMGLATVYIIPAGVETIIWLIILVFCAWVIQKVLKTRYFIHGFLVCMINSLCVTGAHLFLSSAYLAHHPEEAASYAKLQSEYHVSMTQAMLLFSPFIGLMSGLFLGILSNVFALVRQRAA